METPKVDAVVKEKVKPVDADNMGEVAEGSEVEIAEVDAATIGEVLDAEKENNDGTEKGDAAACDEGDEGSRESPLPLPALQYSKVGQRTFFYLILIIVIHN